MVNIALIPGASGSMAEPVVGPGNQTTWLPHKAAAHDVITTMPESEQSNERLPICGPDVDTPGQFALPPVNG